MTNKLWQASQGGLHPLVEQYTAGDDIIYDQQLLGYDITASMAHAKMLESVGLLTSEELQELLKGLTELQKLWEAGSFQITQDQEDGHTAIEQYLTEQLGEVGKKIHAGRSRNDQALVMMRLYLKDSLEQLSASVANTAATYLTAAEKYGDVPMPGYTHLQKAMPTWVSTWLGSFADGFGDVQPLIDVTKDIIDQNPLGSAAGFGVSLPIDRQHTTDTLGFAKVQANPMYCGLSRGLFELMVVQALAPAMVLAGKFAQDMLVFTTQEFNFFSLPDDLTTGSSIMPHKHNYDLFEIMRGQANAYGGYSQQLQSVINGTGSGYNRDLQLTKATTLNAIKVAKDTLEVLSLAVSQLRVNEDVLAAAMTGELNTVDQANKLVQQGMSFRDAYNQVKQGL